MQTTKQRIFAAARELFDQEGAAGVSMRRIAEAVGLTPMAIYRHYADKDALLDALMLDAFAVWEGRAGRIAADDPLAWLQRLMAEYLDFALAEPHRFEAAFLLPAGRARRYPDDFVAGRSPVINLVYERIEAAKANGQIGDAPASEIALCLSALAQGMVSMHRAGRFVGETEFRAAYVAAIHHCLMSFGGKSA